MKSINIVVSGEAKIVKTFVNAISYGPENALSHQFVTKDTQQVKKVNMNFGSLQVDEDCRKEK